MNLNAGKAYRARVGLAGLLAAAVLVVVAKSATGGETAAAAITMPSAPAGSVRSSSAAGSTPTPVAANGATATAGTATATAGTATATAGTANGATATAAATPAAAATASSAPSPAAGKRTVVGSVEDTRYGPVQVELVLNGTTITDVVTLQVPNQERRDIEINDQAVPILRQEVLAAQSAKIDAVSGASFTSSGYAWSVQAALDKAGLAS
jgi:uncharacterized protein with FMN-binding domain